MKALVTGGAGFLGSHLVDALLAAGWAVTVFDHRLAGKCLADATLARVEAIAGDVLDAGAVARAAEGCAVLFHCAAMVGTDAYANEPVRTMETEQIGLRNACRAVRAAGCRQLVYISSSAVYGHAGGSAALEESLEVAPVSNYGIAKRFNELYLAAQHAAHGLSSVALRVFNVYGPRQDQRLVIPRFVHRALAGEPIVLFGDGSQTRDFVYVGDVVAVALACAGLAPCCEVVNVASGGEVSVRTLAETVIRLTGSSSPLVFEPRPPNRTAFEVERCFGSQERLRRLTGQVPETGLEEGLRRTIAGTP